MAMDITSGPHLRDRKATRWRELFSAPLALAAVKQSFVMLRPDIQWRNPVMFVVEVGAALTLLFILRFVWCRRPVFAQLFHCARLLAVAHSAVRQFCHCLCRRAARASPHPLFAYGAGGGTEQVSSVNQAGRRRRGCGG
jgi:hypothetical protein